jgi:F0F1-type ATP synthase membrane subunit c/vacuolar-type H+-ATPase subunit K
MTKFTDHLWSDLVEEHGATLAVADRPAAARPRLLGRPRVLAGGTLGLAGIGTALGLVLTAATSAPAYAVTPQSDGSVLVQISVLEAIGAANAKLAAMGIHEQVTVWFATGPATVPGPITCSLNPRATPSGPLVRVLLGKDGTDEIKAGQSGDNTAEGTYHVDHCVASSGADANNTGNSGTGGNWSGRDRRPARPQLTQ